MYFSSKPTTHLADDRLLKFRKQIFVAHDQPGFDERGFGLHVRVRHLHAIVQVAHGVADFQADVPQRIQHAVNQLRQKRLRFAGGDLPFVQKHEINVAVRIQLRAAEAADGHQRDRWKFLLRRRGQIFLRRPPQVLQQRVQNRRARLADFAATRAGPVLQLEPVRLDFEKIFVAREFFRRGGGGRKRQSRLRGGLDFFEQILHGRIRCLVPTVKGIKNSLRSSNSCGRGENSFNLENTVEPRMNADAHEFPN